MQTQVKALNTQLQSQAFTKGTRTQAAEFAKTRKQATLMQQTWADATASTGLFDVSSRKIKSHTDEWIKSVQQQRLSLRGLMADRGKAYKQAYEQQLRMQNMSMASFAHDKQGNPLASIAVPRHALRDMDTLRMKTGFLANVAESVSTQMINAGKNMQWAGRQLSMGFTAPLVAAGALSAKFAYDMDKQLTQTSKVYDTYATTQQGKEKELSNLRENQLKQAKQIAKEYGMAAADTMSITSQLASAGQRGPALLKNTKETARFATLGDFDKDSAVKASITLKSVFGIQNKELKQAVDFMNNIENSTSLTMQDMATAIPTASGAIKNLNGNYKDMIVLLTAMRERGFAPGESANALKAAGTRLIRPGPQVKKEFTELTGQSITEIRDAAGGDLIKMLLGVANATKNLNNVQKQQVSAALFGTQQAVRLTAAMDGLVKAQSGVGQTAKAMEVAQLSAADNAKVSANEMAQQQKSISGKLKRSIETIKVQLFDMGMAFLKAATIALDAGSSIIGMFQSLPGFAKKGLVVAAVIAAIAGPLLMFIGLSRNLFGQMLKGTAILVKFLTGVGLLTTEQKAGAVASEWANKALKREMDTTSALTMQIEALANAFREAEAAKAALNGTPMVGGGGTASGLISTESGNAQRRAQRASALAAEEASAASAAAANASRKRGLGKVAIGGGVMVAALATQELTTNKIANNIAKWALYGSLAIPVFSAVSKKLVTMGVLSEAAMGPIGLGLAAVTAVGVGLYAWGKHIQKANQEMDDMYNNSDKLAKILNIDPSKAGPGSALKNMSAEQKAQAKIKKDQEESAKLADKLGDAYPAVKKAIKEANGEQAKYNVALMQGLKVINIGGSAEQARKTIEGFLESAQNAADAHKIMLGFDLDLSSTSAVTQRMTEQSDKITKDIQKHMPNYGAIAPNRQAGAHYAPTSLSTEDQSKLKYLGKNMGTILYANLLTEGKKGISVFKDQEKTFKNIQNMIGGNEDARKNMLKGLLSGYGITGKAADNAIEKLKKEHKGLSENVTVAEALAAAGSKINTAFSANQTFGMENFTAKDSSKMQGLYDKTYFATAGSPIEKEKAAAAAVTAELDKMNGKVPLLIAGFGSMADKMAALGVDTAHSREELEKMKTAAASMASGAAADATDKFSTTVTSAAAANHARLLANIERQDDGLEARQKKRQEHLDDSQERAQNALEERWKKRKKALQDEEDLRKRVFDAEVARVQRMKELNNANVDYRVAVNTGNLDAAAKIRNEINATAETNALDDSDKAQAAKFDKAMAKLDDQEAAEKKRLDHIQKLQDRALEHSLDAQKAAAAKSVEIAKKAENERYNAQKAALDKGLAYVKQQEPKTQAELNTAIAEAKKKYHIYGDDLEKASKDWGNNMYSALAKRIRDAYKTITGQDFGKAGKTIADDFMKGVSGGKITTSQIITYMRTGKLPKPAPTKTEAQRNKSVYHGGGALNRASNNRKGYSGSSAPMPSEVTVLAKKSEYMVQSSAHRKYGTDAMDAVNSGQATIIRHDGGPIGLGNSPAALARTAMTAAIQGGLKKGYVNMRKAKSKAASDGAVGSGASMKGVDPKGWNKPWTGHHTTNNGHDYNLIYDKIYAPHSGTVRTHAIKGHEPRVASGGLGFRSYGQYVDFDGGGTNLMFAHLSKLPAAAGGKIKVKAGQYMGTTGETGNATGPHVHVERNHSGDNGQFGEFFRSRGIKLLKGGTVRYDNTPAILHKRERVLAAPLSAKLDEGIDRIASGDTGGYNGERELHVHIDGKGWTPEDIPTLAKAITKEQDKDAARYSRKPKR